jgi:sensor domain CHASE-containing protein
MISLLRTLAGLYELDGMFVYKQKKHEVYKQWVGLMNPENPEDASKGGCTVSLVLEFF